MNKRRSSRFHVFLNAELGCGSENYAGCIGNLSENGMYMRAVFTNDTINFIPGTTFSLKLKLPSGATLNLQCRLVWSYGIPVLSEGGKSAYNLGLEIIDPFPEYTKFYESLAIQIGRDYI